MLDPLPDLPGPEPDLPLFPLDEDEEPDQWELSQPPHPPSHDDEESELLPLLDLEPLPLLDLEPLPLEDLELDEEELPHHPGLPQPPVCQSEHIM